MRRAPFARSGTIPDGMGPSRVSRAVAGRDRPMWFWFWFGEVMPPCFLIAGLSVCWLFAARLSLSPSSLLTLPGLFWSTVG